MSDQSKLEGIATDIINIFKKYDKSQQNEIKNYIDSFRLFEINVNREGVIFTSNPENTSLNSFEKNYSNGGGSSDIYGGKSDNLNNQSNNSTCASTNNFGLDSDKKKIIDILYGLKTYDERIKVYDAVKNELNNENETQ